MNRPTLVLLAALLVAIPLSLVAGRASIFALDDARALLIVLELRLKDRPDTTRRLVVLALLREVGSI